MDDLLLDMWTKINKEAFGGGLEQLAALSFETLSGQDGIGAHGRYVPQSRCMMIDARFEPDSTKANNGNKLELAKCYVTYLLLVHEMVHQSLHLKNAKQPGGHGDEFIVEASRVAEVLRLGAADKDNAARWPPETVAAMKAVADLSSAITQGGD